jgi:hypothetical protein
MAAKRYNVRYANPFYKSSVLVFGKALSNCFIADFWTIVPLLSNLLQLRALAFGKTIASDCAGFDRAARGALQPPLQGRF